MFKDFFLKNRKSDKNSEDTYIQKKGMQKH